MRVFSTFSGISAASAAWKPLGWTFVGYAEVNPYACAVLAARCGATRPKYIPHAEHAYLQDETYALINRLGALQRSPRQMVQRYAVPGEDIDRIDENHHHLAYERLYEDFEEHAAHELGKRVALLKLHRRTTYPVTGTMPNFGDIWSITDEDLEELGPIDLLEGGSPCQAFSVAGSKAGLVDFRGATMLAYLDLVERMRRINGLRWVLWENVKEVLNDKANGFGHLLGGLVVEGGRAVSHDHRRYADAGYVLGENGSVAWRVLDAQRFGRPQRRERVFALAHIGMGAPRRDPREILFEPYGSGGPAGKTRKPREEAALSILGRRIEDVPPDERLVAFKAGQSESAHSLAESRTISPALLSSNSGSNSVPRVAYAIPSDVPGEPRYIVRKMLPVEAERLQGFANGWTDVIVNGEPMSAVHRHACLGNSMTVDVMRWIGERIAEATSDDVETKAA
jgi:DNA (cytosine-5)-methyltransferase 1